MNPLEIQKCTNEFETTAPHLQKLPGQYLVLDATEERDVSNGLWATAVLHTLQSWILHLYKSQGKASDLNQSGCGLISEPWQGLSAVFAGPSVRLFSLCPPPRMAGGCGAV